MNKAFSIIELLVVVLIFSIVIGAAVGVFVSAVKIQRYNLSQQQLLNQVGYAMEYMDRAIRMARTDGTDGINCGFSGQNYRVTLGGQKIEFQNYKGECQEFYLNGSNIRASKGADYSDVLLTSDDFTVNFLRFNVIGASGADNIQPKVTIIMEIEGEIMGSDPKMRIQTTVSQRNLDIP
jgi:prepilin-type N-terminal cleavage/methylation domain-containing protein